MKIIIGLGNPGKEYEKTRHNVGFMALNFIQSRDPAFSGSRKEYKKKLHSIIVEQAKVIEGGNKVESANRIILVYPQTYMNESGTAVKEIIAFYKSDPEKILVIHDDIDLPLGAIRYSKSSGAAGHKGVQSIIDSLGSQNFPRLRIGIENRENPDMPTEAYVLQNFSKNELEKIPWDEIAERIAQKL